MKSSSCGPVSVGLVSLLCVAAAVQAGKVSVARAADASDPVITLSPMLPQAGNGLQPTAAVSSGATVPLTAAETSRIQTYLASRYSESDVKHSFQSKLGEMIDCVDFFAQPAAKALAAKGTPLTAIPEPPPIPERFAAKTSAPPTDEFWFNGYPDALGRARACPKGSVPIVRQTFADIQAAGGLDSFLDRRQKRGALPAFECPTMGEIPGYAHVVENSTTIGGIIEANTTWSIYSPDLTQVPGVSAHEIMQLWLVTGCGLNLPARYGVPQSCNSDANCMRVVELGTLVQTGDVLRFLMAGTNDGYATTLDPIWTGLFLANYQPIGQVSNNSTSTYVEMNADVQLYQGAWWVGVGIRYVGSNWIDWEWVSYYPTSWFTNGKFQTSVDSFQVGGEVCEMGASQWVTRMGSGADAKAGYHQAGYFHDSGVVANGAWNYNFNLGQGNYSPSGSTVPSDYRLSTTGGQSGWLNFFYVGGTPRSFFTGDYGDQWFGAWGSGVHDYTGTCPPGVPVTGLSKPTSGNGAHAIQCGPLAVTMTSCTAYPFGNGDNRGYSGFRNWDPGYYKAECAYNEYLGGLGQDQTTKKINYFVCCPANVNHMYPKLPSVQVFYSGNSSGYGAQNIDWDYGYYKGQCPSGYYAAGVSKVTGSGAPHALLCVPPG